MTGITGTRRLARAALLSIATALLLLTGSSSAWAMLSPPEPGGAGGRAFATSATSASSSDATSMWELLLIGAIGAALAVGVTLLLVRMVNHRHAGATAI